MNQSLIRRKRIAAIELELKFLRAIIEKKIELAVQILYNDGNKRGDQK